jgi:glycerophosphoryl diester phosphodiesterase
MRKKHKIAAFILVLALCLSFLPGKEVNAYRPIDSDGVNLKKSYNNIKYVGHRGASGLVPENTLAGFNLAGELGYWGTECDARTTSDGNWIILHDDIVDTTTNGTGRIKNLSLETVQSLKIDSGSNITTYNGMKIPKLQDYLLICKKWGLVAVIEMKPADNLQYYNKFIEIIKKYGDIKKVIVTSTSKVRLNELRKRDANLTLGLICSIINDSNINYVKKLRNAYIECQYPNVTRDAVVICHKNNIKIGAWVIDDKALADKLIQTGVDIITTNKLLPNAKK